jgi:hypothetical protein
MPSSINVSLLLLSRQKLENYLSLYIKILSLSSVTILLSVTCLPFPKLQSLCFDCKFTYIKLQSYLLIILLILYNCYRLLGWFYIASFILSSSYALFYLHFIINCASDHLVLGNRGTPVPIPSFGQKLGYRIGLTPLQAIQLNGSEYKRALKVVDEFWNTYTSLWSLFSLLPIRAKQQKRHMTIVMINDQHSRTMIVFQCDKIYISLPTSSQ